jgi:hypothetical protein
VRVLNVFRVMLVVSIVAYLTTLAAGVAGLLSADIAMLAGIVLTLTIGVSAIGCVATQLTLLISRKRHISHG